MWVTYGWHITPHYFILQDTLLNLLIMQGHSRYMNTHGTHNYRKCVYKCINIISHVYILFSNSFFNVFPGLSESLSKRIKFASVTAAVFAKRSTCGGKKRGANWVWGKNVVRLIWRFPGEKNRQCFYFKLQYLLIISKSYLFFVWKLLEAIWSNIYPRSHSIWIISNLFFLEMIPYTVVIL